MDLWPTYTFSCVYSLSCTCSQWPVVDEQAGLCAHKILFTNPGGCLMGCGLPNAALDPNIQLPSEKMLHKFPEVTCLQASSSLSSIRSFSMKTPLSTKRDTLAPALTSPSCPPDPPPQIQSVTKPCQFYFLTTLLIPCPFCFAGVCFQTSLICHFLSGLPLRLSW